LQYQARAVRGALLSDDLSYSLFERRSVGDAERAELADDETPFERGEDRLDD
jgi:hypothetical protein